MAFREVTMLEVTEGVRTWLSGLGKKEVARRIGLDVKTVRRYVKAAEQLGLSPALSPAALSEELTASLMAKLEPDRVRPRGGGWSSCEEHREFIGSRLKSRVRLTKIRKLLRRLGEERPGDGAADEAGEVRLEKETQADERREELRSLGGAHEAPVDDPADEPSTPPERGVSAMNEPMRALKTRLEIGWPRSR